MYRYLRVTLTMSVGCHMTLIKAQTVVPTQMTVEAQSSAEVSVQFKPSRLGLSEQKAAISFASKQVPGIGIPRTTNHTLVCTIREFGEQKF